MPNIALQQAEFVRSLEGRCIAVPESRNLNVLDELLSRRGALVLRCPLVNIIDAPDEEIIQKWLQRFIAQPPDVFILQTGEGLSRLRSFAVRVGIAEKDFKSALEKVTTISRGPKPARELRYFGLTPDKLAAEPTTKGVIETLGEMDLDGKSVAVQMYGDEPNEVLLNYLHQRQAFTSTVSPYRYAAQICDEDVGSLISNLANGQIDAIVFTSKSQVCRLFNSAAEAGRTEELKTGLEITCIAAVGPVVGSALNGYGCLVDVMPKNNFFMKPLVEVLTKVFGH